MVVFFLPICIGDCISYIYSSRAADGTRVHLEEALLFVQLFILVRQILAVKCSWLRKKSSLTEKNVDVILSRSYPRHFIFDDGETSTPPIFHVYIHRRVEDKNHYRLALVPAERMAPFQRVNINQIHLLS